MAKKQIKEVKKTEDKAIKVEVDRGACIGCGNCINTCPEVFELDEEGISTVNEENVNNKNLPDILDAKGSCSTGAISVDGDDED